MPSLGGGTTDPVLYFSLEDEMEFYKPERFEDWESVETFPDYEVSNTGLVENTRLGHILEPVTHHSGAMVVSMKHESGRFKQVQVKRLVMGAFKKTVSVAPLPSSSFRLSSVASIIAPPPGGEAGQSL